MTSSRAWWRIRYWKVWQPRSIAVIAWRFEWKAVRRNFEQTTSIIRQELSLDSPNTCAMFSATKWWRQHDVKTLRVAVAAWRANERLWRSMVMYASSTCHRRFTDRLRFATRSNTIAHNQNKTNRRTGSGASTVLSSLTHSCEFYCTFLEKQ